MQIYPIFSLNQPDYFRIVDSTSKLYDAIFIFPPGIETEIMKRAIEFMKMVSQFFPKPTIGENSKITSSSNSSVSFEKDDINSRFIRRR